MRSDNEQNFNGGLGDEAAFRASFESGKVAVVQRPAGEMAGDAVVRDSDAPSVATDVAVESSRGPCPVYQDGDGSGVRLPCSLEDRQQLLAKGLQGALRFARAALSNFIWFACTVAVASLAIAPPVLSVVYATAWPIALWLVTIPILMTILDFPKADTDAPGS